MTMADIARHAEVSRATLYRRWPNVQAVVAALMTREWTIALVSAFQPDAVDGRARLVEGVVEVVAKTRMHPLMRKIVELDPEFLTPYLMERRGSSTVAHLALVEAGIRRGRPTARSATAIRCGWRGRSSWSRWRRRCPARCMAEPDEYPKLDEELRVMLTRYLTP